MLLFSVCWWNSLNAIDNDDIDNAVDVDIDNTDVNDVDDIDDAIDVDDIDADAIDVDDIADAIDVDDIDADAIDVDDNLIISPICDGGVLATLPRGLK